MLSVVSHPVPEVPACFELPAILGGTTYCRGEFPAWPVFDESEERAVLEVLRSGQWWKNSLGEAVGEVVPESKVGLFQSQFAHFQNAAFGVACASGTAALELALKAAGVGPGDEVILPPYTFVATATAALQLDAVPVFCDVEADTLNLSPSTLEQRITPRTRAVIPVHFAGLPADMERILAIARQHQLIVIEDAAHAHGATWKGKAVGALGDAGAFSFQASKNMTAGEGGAVVTNCRDLARMCESYVWAGREFGRPWYEHHRLGWNYRMTEFQAAILIEQLKRLELQAQLRMKNGLRLAEELEEFPGLHPLAVPGWVTRHAFHLFVLRFVEAEFGLDRDRFVRSLRAEGIPCSSGYAHPLYRNPLFQHRAFASQRELLTTKSSTSVDECAARCPNAEQACKEVVWIEHRVLLGNDSDISAIIRAVKRIYEHRLRIRSELS